MNKNPKAVEELKQEILAAFAEVPLPPIGNTFKIEDEIELDEEDDDEDTDDEDVDDEETELEEPDELDESTQQALSEFEEWSNYDSEYAMILSDQASQLPPQFWNKGHRILEELTAEAYQYFLPQSLLACLNFGTPLWDSYYHLAPQLRLLYLHGKDDNFEYQTSLFTPAQSKAVCSFLSYCFDQSADQTKTHSHGFWITRACYWGWNKVPHPFVDFSRDFHEGMRNFEYPPLEDIEDESAREAISQIRFAFAETPPPGNVQLTSGPDLDLDDSEVELVFAGADWRTLHPDLLSRYYCAYHQFQGVAFRYFCPAFLIAEILGPVLDANFYTTGCAMYTLVDLGNQDTDFEEDRAFRYAEFTERERKGIAAYMRYYKGDDEERANAIEKDIKNFWERENTQ